MNQPSFTRDTSSDAGAGGLEPPSTPISAHRSQPRAAPGTRPLLLALCVWFLGAPGASAERYLTENEARTLCFPQADRFEERLVRFTPEQRKAIESRSGLKVRNAGNRVWIARRGTNALGVLVLDHVLGKHEIIDYAVAIAPDGRVLQVEVLEFRESHGAEIRGEKWRAQFKGKTASSKLKLHDDIYNLSGATISCRQVTEGTKRVLATYELVLRPSLAARRLPDPPAQPKD